MTDDPCAPTALRGHRPAAPPPSHPHPVLPLSPGLLAAALDEIDHAILVLDVPSGRLRHANRQALAEAGRYGTLSLLDGIVAATDGVAQRDWLTALQGAACGRRALVTLWARAPDDPADRPPEHEPADPPSRGQAVSVAVVPLAAGDGGGHRQALAVFGKRQIADRLSIGFFARLHGLTPTEGAVLAGLCRGLKPAEVAAVQGVALSTVRTHVNAIRLKTGVGSLRELVHKVSTLPPMAPALRTGPL